MTVKRVVREVARVVLAKRTTDGAGVTLKRSIGGSSIPEVDPFLLLDEFKSDDPNDYIAGFPDHPHRGFETVTYMLAGSFEHRDHKGNCGRLGPGSVQWMTAGRGIIHSETPLQDKGLVWGFQLWVNLPSTHKMIEPRYQDIPAEQVPTVSLPQAKVKVIAGEIEGVRGPVRDIVTAPLYLDVEVPIPTSASAPITLQHRVPVGHNVFVYVFQGSAQFGSTGGKSKAGWPGTLLVFENPEEEGAAGEDREEVVQVTVDPANAGDATSVRYLLVAAKPINEPIARRGPFVMNTQQELMQAFIDFSTGKF